ncbi:MAG TPA: zf-HC2 domain-containing protein [Chloroflexota bacterium]|nr:zf-HC2 domain-containing protein [Chloroflexota bacterium]
MTEIAGHGELRELLPAYVNGSLDRPSTERVRQHLMICRLCQSELVAWEAVESATRLAHLVTPVPSEGVLDRVWEEIELTEDLSSSRQPKPSAVGVASRGSLLGRIRLMRGLNGRQLTRSLVGAAAAVAIAGALVLTPVGSYAQDFLTIFQPTQFVAVPVTIQEMRSLPGLNDYGSFSHSPPTKPTVVPNAAAAGTATGMTVLTPSSLPSGVPSTVTYAIQQGGSVAFTFSATKAQQSAAAKGVKLPPMPANIDGSTLQVTTGPVVAAVYGDPKLASEIQSVQTESAAKKGQATGTNAATSPNPASMPPLVIVQTTVPTVRSTGVSVRELEDYLLEQPSISPDLAATIRAIGDPSSTLPIPIPVNKAVSHSVTVQGVTGLRWQIRRAWAAASSGRKTTSSTR